MMRRFLAGLGCFVLLIQVTSCGSGKNAAIAVTAAQWPQADALFHRDPRWLGSDGAFSVPLHDGRILWLFGDTLVATTPAHIRSQAAFVRNTVAVERGTNPTSASMAFYWGRSHGRPASFFSEDGSRWFWPQHGIRLGRALVVFLERLEQTGNPDANFNFEHAGWRLAVVGDATAGAEFPGYLLRWRIDNLAVGRVAEAQWWAGRHGWVPLSELRRAPTPILRNAGSECSLTFDRRLDRWVLTRRTRCRQTRFAPPSASPRCTTRASCGSRSPESSVHGARWRQGLRCRGGVLVLVMAAPPLIPRSLRVPVG
jgi:hypothetical protein